MNPANDPTYADAAMIALTRTIGVMFRALLKEGMTRKEALTVVLAWMTSALREGRENRE